MVGEDTFWVMDPSTRVKRPAVVEPVSEAGVRAAATVILLRPRSHGFDVLLTERSQQLRFMGGATVFPGGAMASADLDPAWERASTTGQSESLGARVCALREAFEEVGWISGEGPVDLLTFDDVVDPARWLARCLELGVRLGTEQLVYAGRWVTPLGSPIRFDTSFFVTIADDDFEPRPNRFEVVSCRWSTAAEALAALGAGHVIMAPPTIEMLQRLDAYEQAPDVVEAFRTGSGEPSGDVLAARLSPLVQVVLAPNPSLMTGPGTNTYVVGAGGCSAVVDVAVADEGYLDAIERAAGGVMAILVTHRHPDHVGGVAELARRTGAPVAAFGPAAADGAPIELPIADGSMVRVGGLGLRALHTPGHAPDHICWLLEGTASLFSGDNVLGEGTAVISPPEGDMRTYLDSLRRLNALDIQRIYPGHWRPLNGGNAVIESYIAHRSRRQEAILATLKPSPKSPEDIVAEVYADTSPDLHPLARQSVIAHLLWLEEEGLAAREGERWIALRARDRRGEAAE